MFFEKIFVRILREGDAGVGSIGPLVDTILDLKTISVNSESAIKKKTENLPQ